MKNRLLVLLIIVASLVSPYLNSVWAGEDVEVIFSETFEGDLSRWEAEGENPGEKINLYKYKNEDDPEEEEYLSYVLRIDQKEKQKMTTLKSPIIEVEPMEKYTFAVDMKGGGNQIAYIIYMDEDGERINGVGEKFTVHSPNQWQCASITVTIPDGVTRLRLHLTHAQSLEKGYGEYDNVVVCKGKIGFNKELDKRKVYAPLAVDDSGILWEDENIVFYDTFENGINEKWVYATEGSQNKKFKSSKENSFTGMRSLKVTDEYVNKSFGLLGETFSVIPKAKYELAADFYNPLAYNSGMNVIKTIGGNPEIYLRFYDSDEKEIYSRYMSEGKSEWETHSISITAPENAQTAKVCVYSGTYTGTSYIDNIKVTVTQALMEEGPDDTKYDEVYKNALVLFIGSPNALVNGKKTFIDEANQSVVADIVNSRTLVPVRFIAENYGAEVLWDEASRTVTLNLPGKTATIVLDKNEINVSGNVVPIDVPAQIIEGRTMLPLRAFVEQVMGKTVFWDERGLIVITDDAVLDKEKDQEVINTIIDNIK